MGMVRIEKGKHLIHKDDAQEKLEIILQGRVNMIVGDEVIPLDTGTIIGIAACEKQRYCCDYIAAEDTVLMEYPYKQVADLEKLFAEQPKYATVFPMAAVKQANTVLNYYGKRTELAKKLYSMGVGMYRDYKYLCSKYDLTEKQLMSMEHLVPLEQSYILEEWKQGYFQALAGKDMQSVNAFLGTDFAVGIGTMLYAGKVINEVLAKMEGVRDYLHYWQDILLEEGGDDLFQLYFDLEIRATRKGADTSDIQQRMEKLMEAAEGMSVTLHRAFDVCKDPKAALEQATELGIQTILTSGQQNSALKGAPLLKELKEQAAGRIQIQAGGGICAEVIEKLYPLCGVTAYHMSGKTELDSKMEYRKEGVNMGLPSLSEYTIYRTSEAAVRAARNVLDR